MRRHMLIVLLPLVAAAAFVASSCGKETAPIPAAPPLPQRLVPPLCDAQVGEWLRLEAGREAQIYRVVSAGDYFVEIETTNYEDQAPVGTPQRAKLSRNSFGLPEECLVRTIDADRIQINDKWYDCWRFFVTSRIGLEKYYWFSDEIPVQGLLKVANIRKGVADEHHAAKLVEWGK